jgi:uncharacterized protein (TIGR03435 family)
VPKPIAGNPILPTPRLLLMAALVALTASASAQTAIPAGWQTAAGGKLSFDVASIRPSIFNAPADANVDLDASDYFPRYHGGLVRTNGLLVNYIIFAYRIEDASQYPLMFARLPKWAQTEQFTVEARPSGNPTKDQIRLMMQALLADRFKLAIHAETRQLPVYALVLDKPGKPGPQLQPHPDDGLCTKPPDPSAQESKSTTPAPYCGPLFWPVNGQTHMRMMDYSMDGIAGQLASFGPNMGGLDRIPVLNRTGLSGKFDINLEFLRSDKRPAQPDSDSQSEAPGASFSDALKSQAGLKLVKQTGAVDVYVIDHVERPSEN